MRRELQIRIAVIVLALFAIVAAMQVASSILAPFALAFVVSVVLSPISSGFRRIGLPHGVGSLFSFATVLLILMAIVFLAEPIVNRIVAEAPSLRWELRKLLIGVREIFGGLLAFTGEVGAAVDGQAQAGAAASADMPSMMDAIVMAPAVAAQIMVFAGALFFLLLCRDDLYRWLAKLVATGQGRYARADIAAFREADKQVARYFITIALINMCFGALVALALSLVGLPNAALWGIGAAAMNFVLYLGPALTAVALLGAGVLVFDGAQIFLPPAVFIGLNMLEGQFVTPTLVGRSMQVNPLLVFTTLCLMLWVWGAIGGIVAIPLLVWGKAVIGRLGLTETLENSAQKPGFQLL